VTAAFDFPARIEVVDSHTEGEPTRVVIDGWPALAGATMGARRDDLLRRHDHLRRAVVCEPRGHDAVVGALLTPPVDPASTAGVLFFNNAGALGMCGHGLVGVVRTLEHLGRLGPGALRIDTAVGPVGAELHDDGSVTVENVPAFCHARDVEVAVPGLGRVRGDVAWGGNWFFLSELPAPPLELEHLAALTDVTTRIRGALRAEGLTGREGEAIDHIELFGPSPRPDADARSFVLCPGLAWDRSPCGTGTSAKMATLAARGRLRPGGRWRQESLTGGLFEGWLEQRGPDLIPFIRGRAFVTGRSTLLFDPEDPFRVGFSAVR
jgi:4-hydroxyproline epimerase